MSVYGRRKRGGERERTRRERGGEKVEREEEEEREREALHPHAPVLPHALDTTAVPEVQGS